MKNYFNELFEKFSNLTDEQFDQLLVESGIEECPLKELYYEEGVIKITPKYGHKLHLNRTNNNLTQYNTYEREKVA